MTAVPQITVCVSASTATVFGWLFGLGTGMGQAAQYDAPAGGSPQPLLFHSFSRRRKRPCCTFSSFWWLSTVIFCPCIGKFKGCSTLVFIVDWGSRLIRNRGKPTHPYRLGRLASISMKLYVRHCEVRRTWLSTRPSVPPG